MPGLNDDLLYFLINRKFYLSLSKNEGEQTVRSGYDWTISETFVSFLCTVFEKVSFFIPIFDSVAMCVGLF